MENKQTAVDWIRKELEGYGSPSALNIDWETFDELIAQAKEMEKEQMIEFFMKGQNTYPSEYVLDNKQIAKQYYKETYED
ncbi:MAG: hypothetical protein ACK5DE_09830 [Bacteroidota bacterium]|jgi:hypothetical protein